MEKRVIAISNLLYEKIKPLLAKKHSIERNQNIESKNLLKEAIKKVKIAIDFSNKRKSKLEIDDTQKAVFRQSHYETPPATEGMLTRLIEKWRGYRLFKAFEYTGAAPIYRIEATYGLEAELTEDLSYYQIIGIASVRFNFIEEHFNIKEQKNNNGTVTWEAVAKNGRGVKKDKWLLYHVTKGKHKAQCEINFYSLNHELGVTQQRIKRIKACIELLQQDLSFYTQIQENPDASPAVQLESWNAKDLDTIKGCYKTAQMLKFLGQEIFDKGSPNAALIEDDVTSFDDLFSSAGLFKENIDQDQKDNLAIFYPDGPKNDHKLRKNNNSTLLRIQNIDSKSYQPPPKSTSPQVNNDTTNNQGAGNKELSENADSDDPSNTGDPFSRKALLPQHNKKIDNANSERSSLLTNLQEKNDMVNESFTVNKAHLINNASDNDSNKNKLVSDSTVKIPSNLSEDTDASTENKNPSLNLRQHHPDGDQVNRQEPFLIEKNSGRGDNVVKKTTEVVSGGNSAQSGLSTEEHATNQNNNASKFWGAPRYVWGIVGLLGVVAYILYQRNSSNVEKPVEIEDNETTPDTDNVEKDIQQPETKEDALQPNANNTKESNETSEPKRFLNNFLHYFFLWDLAPGIDGDGYFLVAEEA